MSNRFDTLFVNEDNLIKMNRILLTTLIVVGFTTPALAENNSSKIPVTGVIAHSVLSKVELAKVKNFEINKAIEIEKEKTKLSLTEHKTTIINSSAEAYLSNLPESSEPIIKRMKDLSSHANILSEGFLWAEGILDESRESVYKQELTSDLENLNARLIQSRALRNEIEGTLNLLEIELSKIQRLEEKRQSKETKKLLEAKDDELKNILENKLLLGDFEYNIYYITAQSELQREERELLRRIFKSISDIKNISVEITGRADPRGDRTYNENLASERANVIKLLAEEAGVNKKMITVNSYVSDTEIKRNRELHFFDRNSTIIVKKIGKWD